MPKFSIPLSIFLNLKTNSTMLKRLFFPFFLPFCLNTTCISCQNEPKPDAITAAEPSNKVEKIEFADTTKMYENIIFDNQKGIIKNYVCGRGCYQYVLETTHEGKPLKISPDELDEALKKDNLAVIFSGKTNHVKVIIMRPLANDATDFDFYAQKLIVKNIKKAE